MGNLGRANWAPPTVSLTPDAELLAMPGGTASSAFCTWQNEWCTTNRSDAPIVHTNTFNSCAEQDGPENGLSVEFGQ